jgi:glutathione S-transferase
MKLYYFETMNPRKVCATAKYLDSPVQYIRLDPQKGEHKTPEHLARNPNGRVPVLEDGDKMLWESAAIMMQLALKAGSDIWPARDPARQVEVLRWISWDICEWAPHIGAFYFQHVIKAMFKMGEPDLAALERKVAPLRASAKILDAQLGRQRFLTGDALTIADFCAGVLLPYAEQCAMPLSDFANIQRWHGELMALPAWRDPWP